MRVLATAVLLLIPSLAPARVCKNSCIEAARVDYVECRKGASETFALERQLCRDRDPACVEACATRQDDCRTATGIDPALEACRDQQRAAVTSCTKQSPVGSKKREHCLDDARIAGFQCRNRARRGTASDLRRCRQEFRSCAEGCGPGRPPRGARLCQVDALHARSSAVATCNQTADADKAGCRNKDLACAEGCRDARTACEAAPSSALASAIASCEAQRRAAATACRAMNPGGGAALDQCLETADTNGFVCRNTATKAQAPAFAACTQQYVGCVRACPPP